MLNLLAITFVHGAILGAAAVAAAPIIIHLLMRSKPRLVIFPALRFVRLTHNANVSRHRLKHFLLLMMRMSAIALVAIVLARPKIETSGSVAFGGRDPVSAVVVMDTSGSMLYRVAGQPRLQDARRIAVELLENLPKDSDVAVIWPDRPGHQIELTRDIGSCVKQVQELADRPDRPADSLAPSMRTGQRVTMAPLLIRAYASLANATHARREVYVLNDCTRDSWADVGLGVFADQESVTTYLIDIGAGGNQDYLLSEARWPGQVVSPRQSPAVNVTVRAGQLADKQVVCAVDSSGSKDSVEVDFSGPQTEASGQIRRIDLSSQGLHATRVYLDVQDALPENNARYLALDVGPPPLVLMIQSETVGGGWSVGTLVEATLAPPRARSLGTALVDLVHVQAADFLKPATEAKDRERLANAHAVILADVRILGDAQWQALENYVGAGGTLIVLLGPNTDPGSMSSAAAMRVLAAPGIDRLVELASPVAAAYPHFDKSVSRVLTVYHENNRTPRFHRELVMKYYGLPAGKPLPPTTAALIELSDQARSPLLLERSLGSGRSLLLTTAGLGDWTQWSQRETHATLVYSMALAYPRGLERAHEFIMDAPAAVTVPAAFRTGTATLTLPDARGTMKLEINLNTGAMALPTRFLGHYRVELRSPAGNRQELLYAVNVDPQEFLLERIDPSELKTSFASNRFVALAGGDEMKAGLSRGRGGPKEIGPLIGLALLLLLIGESFFANRFYRMPTVPAGPAPTPVGPAGGPESR